MGFLSTQPYKGTRDFYPEDQAVQRWIFEKMRQVLQTYGFAEYDGPMLEPFELYAAKTGSEIVNKQLYWLVDQGQRKLAVRPEMTPTLARMVAARLQQLAKPIRWYSVPNLWRYERPQRGRLREHWQLNCDILGGEAVFADAEILEIAYDLVHRGFSGEKFIEIRVNHRGLVDALFKQLGMAQDQVAAVIKILDARAKMTDEAYQTALKELHVNPQQSQAIEQFLASDFKTVEKKYPGPATEHLKALFDFFQRRGMQNAVIFDPKIMRGMDYYTAMVFEIYDRSPENNRAMFGGGRYDNLIGLFGKEQLSGVGFGMGDVTLRNFLESHQLLPSFKRQVDVFVTQTEASAQSLLDELSAKLRKEGLSVVSPLALGKLGKQLKQADQEGARFALICGADELKSSSISLKDLKSGEQETLTALAVVDKIKKLIGVSNAE